jgi:hypothetical protein
VSCADYLTKYAGVRPMPYRTEINTGDYWVNLKKNVIPIKNNITLNQKVYGGDIVDASSIYGTIAADTSGNSPYSDLRFKFDVNYPSLERFAPQNYKFYVRLKVITTCRPLEFVKKYYSRGMYTLRAYIENNTDIQTSTNLFVTDSN